MRLAKIALAKRSQQVFTEEWGIVDSIAGRQSLYAFIDKTYTQKKKDRCTAIRSVLSILKKYPGGTTIQLAQITETWFENFRKWLLEKIAISTAETYTRVIRTALNTAVRKNIIPKNPTKNVQRLKTPKSKRIWLNADELKAMAKTPLDFPQGDEVRRAFFFACNTGLRISDLKSLTWGDIEYSPLQLVKRQEKTDEQVCIPLNSTAWDMINDGMIHDYRSPIFKELSQVSHCHFLRLKQWANDAGVKKNIGWHTARHTFAVQSLLARVDIFTLSKLLGHTDVKTTQIYAQVTDQLKREAVEALPTVGFKV
ncbi:MAG: site-specific integrase [Treponema sp.]|nr:site-specific integrase [Treponema sp.]